MDKLLEILKSAGFPYAYDHFAEGKHRIRLLSVTCFRGAITFPQTGRCTASLRKSGWNCIRISKTLKRSRTWKMFWTQRGFFITSRKPGLTAKSCMKFSTLLKCQQTEKVLGKPG